MIRILAVKLSVIAGLFAVANRLCGCAAPAKTDNNAIVVTGKDGDVIALAIHPSGKFAYALNSVDLTTNPTTGSISMFTINPGTGVLMPMTPATVATGNFPQSIVVDPLGKFVYVPNHGDGLGNSGSFVFMYAIDPITGVLTPTSPATVNAGTAPFSVTTDSTGKFAYVACWGSNYDAAGSVSMFTIDSTTGVLTPTSPASVPTGFFPQSVQTDPSGKFAYVANSNDGSVSMYTIDSTSGVLTATHPATISAGANPQSISIHPSGKYAYVADNGVTISAGGAPSTVFMFTINQSTGVLSLMSPISVGTLANPEAIVTESTGRFAYVANQFANGQTDNGTISMYAIDQTTGALTATNPSTIGTGGWPIWVTTDPSGKFAYAVNFASRSISMYTINATTGLLTATNPATIITVK